MDRSGITMQLLSLPGLFGVDSLCAEEALPLVATFNDEAAAAARADVRHFAAIASLPLADVRLACCELERAHAIGLLGAILPADAMVTRDTAERLLPLFETGNRLGSHFFVHPGPAAAPAERNLRTTGVDAWQRHIVLETQATLSQAFLTLELTGYLDPFPNVTVQIANLGGCLPFLLERMDSVFVAEKTGTQLPSARLGRCYVDTASFGSRAIGLAVSCLGADRIVLGTDAPLFAAQRALDAVVAARLDPDQHDLLMFRNAERLIAARSSRPDTKSTPAGFLVS